MGMDGMDGSAWLEEPGKITGNFHRRNLNPKLDNRIIESWKIINL
jgi:hypothetical protein